MPLVNDIRTLLAPLTNDPESEWFIKEGEFSGATYRNFANPPANLLEIFKKSATEFADNDFLVYEDIRYTYGQAWVKIQALGKALVEDYGIAKGDRVAIAGRNSSEWIMATMAVISVGGVAVLLNGWWVRRELKYALDDCGAKLVFADNERLNRMGDLVDNSKLVAIGLNLKEAVSGVIDISDVIEKHAGSSLPTVDIDGEDIAWMLYTSGTTGFPKGAISSHRAVVAAILCFQFTFVAAGHLDPELAEVIANPPYQACVLMSVPLFHVTGSCAILMTSINAGRKVVLMYKWDAEEALKLIEQERANFFTGVPTMSWEMANHPNFDKYDTSSLSTVSGGGAPTPNEHIRVINNKFTEGRPSIGYGLTETNAATASNVGDLLLSKPRSLMPTILTDLEIRSPEGKVLQPLEVGIVWIRAAFLYSGYWNKPEATAQALQNGWFDSGDLGYIDEDGLLYIEDRAKEMVLRGGENIYCAEVENALFEIEGIFEAAVFGLPDTRLGEVVTAAVVLKQGVQLTQDDIRSQLVDKIAKFKIPDNVYFYEGQLTRGATGKIQKRDNRDEIIKTLDV